MIRISPVGFNSACPSGQTKFKGGDQPDNKWIKNTSDEFKKTLEGHEPAPVPEVPDSIDSLEEFPGSKGDFNEDGIKKPSYMEQNEAKKKNTDKKENTTK